MSISRLNGDYPLATKGRRSRPNLANQWRMSEMGGKWTLTSARRSGFPLAMRKMNKWLPRRGSIIGLVVASVALLVVGLPVLMFTLQSGACTGMTATCRDESLDLDIALIAVATMVVGTGWVVRKFVISNDEGNYRTPR